MAIEPTNSHEKAELFRSHNPDQKDRWALPFKFLVDLNTLRWKGVMDLTTLTIWAHEMR
jgi:hypothetical protein